jgi:hypothetical protein
MHSAASRKLNPRHIVRDEAKLKETLKKGRRKGGKSARKIVNAAISGITADLLEVLNYFYPRIHAFKTELSEQFPEISWLEFRGAFEGLVNSTDTGDDKHNPVPDLTLFRAMAAIQEMIDSTILDGEPRREQARRILESELLACIAKRDHHKCTPSRPVTGQTSPEIVGRMFRSSRRLSEANDLAIRLLQAFWAAPLPSIQRVRKCAYARCPAPYFLDGAIAGHAKFCRPAHRVAYHRADN